MHIFIAWCISELTAPSLWLLGQYKHFTYTLKTYVVYVDVQLMEQNKPRIQRFVKLIGKIYCQIILISRHCFDVIGYIEHNIYDA